jgi:hypothetical protein
VIALKGRWESGDGGLGEEKNLVWESVLLGCTRSIREISAPAASSCRLEGLSLPKVRFAHLAKVQGVKREHPIKILDSHITCYFSVNLSVNSRNINESRVYTFKDIVRCPL